MAKAAGIAGGNARATVEGIGNFEEGACGRTHLGARPEVMLGSERWGQHRGGNGSFEERASVACTAGSQAGGKAGGNMGEATVTLTEGRSSVTCTAGSKAGGSARGQRWGQGGGYWPG